MRCSGSIFFSSAQNDFAIVRRLAIDNSTGQAFTSVRITLRAERPILRERIWNLDRIAPEAEVEIRDLSTPLDIESLAGLDEAEFGALDFGSRQMGLRPLSRRAELSCSHATNRAACATWLKFSRPSSLRMTRRWQVS